MTTLFKEQPQLHLVNNWQILSIGIIPLLAGNRFADRRLRMSHRGNWICQIKLNLLHWKYHKIYMKASPKGKAFKLWIILGSVFIAYELIKLCLFSQDSFAEIGLASSAWLSKVLEIKQACCAGCKSKPFPLQLHQ